MIRALESIPKWTKLLALMLSNGLDGMSGALCVPGQKYADIRWVPEPLLLDWQPLSSGRCSLAGSATLPLKLSAAVIGSVIYFVIRAFVIKMGMNPNYMKLLSAIVVTLALCIPVAANKMEDLQGILEGECIMLIMTNVRKTFNKGTINGEEGIKRH